MAVPKIFNKAAYGKIEKSVEETKDEVIEEKKEIEELKVLHPLIDTKSLANREVTNKVQLLDAKV